MKTILKNLDPQKYPPNETLEQAARRFAGDQVEFGVADGEPDLRYILTVDLKNGGNNE